MGDVEVERFVVGHRPRDAELVGEIVPHPPAALAPDHAARETLRAPRRDVPRVHAQPLQDPFRRLGQLLHQVHDDDFLIETQPVNQLAVGDLVDARLVAAEVDGDAVGLAVVEGREDPLPGRCHGPASGGQLSEATKLPTPTTTVEAISTRIPRMMSVWVRTLEPFHSRK